MRNTARRLLAATAATALLSLATPAGADEDDIEVPDVTCTAFLEGPTPTQLGILFWIDGVRSRHGGDYVLEFVPLVQQIGEVEEACAGDPSATLGEILGLGA